MKTLFHSSQSHLRRFGFIALSVDIVSGDNQMIAIDQFHFRAPTPIRSASRIGIRACDGESIFDGVASAEHDRGVIVETIHPTGFVLIGEGVIAKGEQAMLRLTLDGGLIQKESKAPLQYDLDIAYDLRLIR